MVWRISHKKFILFFYSIESREESVMKIYDMHCDTISRMKAEREQGGCAALAENTFHLDIEKMKKGGYALQTFAIFLDKEQETDCFIDAGRQLEIFKDELRKNQKHILQVFTFQDILDNEKTGKLSALLSLEEGAIFQNSPEDLQWFYNQGVRMATFTWNYENDLGYPNCMLNPFQDIPWSLGEERGLKKKGFEMLEEMERLHMIPDVSHLSDGGFWDIAKHAKRPFAASHSNARGAAPNAARNLTDEMIRALAEKGGIMGLNYCVSFVRKNWKPGQPGAFLEELIRQIQYILNVGGGECLGLGSDFDGIEEAPEMGDAGGMQRLAEAMEGAGIYPSQIEKICYGNVKRFLKETLA